MTLSKYDIITIAQSQAILSFLSVCSDKKHADEVMYYAEQLDEMLAKWIEEDEDSKDEKRLSCDDTTLRHRNL